MIVIAGANHDDILYFDGVLANKRQEAILGRYTISIGTIFNQEVIVVHELYTSTLASAIITHILDRFFVDLIIVVGKCIAINDRIKNGDLVISDTIIDANVDLTPYYSVLLGEIPGFERDFKVQNDIIGYLQKGLERRTYVNFHHAVILSSDNLSQEMLDIIQERKEIFGIKNSKFVLDQNSAGIAIAANLREVPFITLKVVENRLGEESNIETYMAVLARYIDLGKAVVATINDIGRNDILEGEDAHV